MQWNKIPTKILVKYSNYINAFLPNLATDLPKNAGMNKYAIELIDGKQLLYGPIYVFSPVKLEILKTYIKTHPNTGFI